MNSAESDSATTSAGKRDLQVGFVGLGDQGAPMAQRILAAGWKLHVYARRSEVQERFAKLGAIVVSSLRELAQRCDVIHIMVVTDAQVREVVSGDNLLSGMRAGGILLVHSTVHPVTCQSLAAETEKCDVQLLDAAVSGGALQAAAGELTVMVGGDAAAFAKVEPILSSFAAVIKRMGEVGTGQVAKLINNYLYAAHQATARDADALIRSLGLDVAAAHAVLPTCSGSSWVFGRIANSERPPRYHPKGDRFALEVIAKDIHNLRDYARGRGIAEPLCASLVDRVLELAAAGELRFAG